MLATYQKTLFEKENFSICIFKPENVNEVPVSACNQYGTFVGTGYEIPHSEDIQLQLDGEWETTKYGMQLKIKSCISVLPKTEEGIIAFLSSGVLPYIRNKTAVRLYNRFGINVFSVLETNPDEWLKVRGITPKKLKAIKEAYTINYGCQDLLMFLAPSGISVGKIKKIVDKFGATAAEKVKKNPYVLFKINDFGFKTVDEIAQKNNTPKNDSLRIMGAIKFILTEAQNSGNLCMPQKQLCSAAYLLLNEREDTEAVTLKEVTDSIVKMAQDGILKGDNGFAYLSYNYDNEVFAAEKIKELLLNKIKSVNVDPDITEFERKNFPLAEKQKEAIQMFFSNRFSIITGGPGTGKSTVLKAILETVYSYRKNANILLLAPTGKAARRMTEATGYNAYTIHSALGINEETKISNIKNVNADVIIVDEVSMCDMKLFAILMAAVDSKHTQLLLAGDSDQLPSVGAGNVLNELITCGKVPVTRLNLVYRQSSQSAIPVNAEKINLGNSKLFYSDDFKFIVANEQDLCCDTVIAQYIFEAMNAGTENCCILCPMKSKGLNCVNEYNKKIQQTLNPPASDKPELQLKNGVFRVSDRVMQTKNTEQVSNGETGFIVEIKKDEDDNNICGIRFDDKPEIIWYYPEDMNSITLAYAMTVHKSQGSEYERVIIPMMKSFYVMLKRNLLYTAVTRAKSKVILVGQKQAVYMAVNTTETDKRMTQLGKRI